MKYDNDKQSFDFGEVSEYFLIVPDKDIREEFETEGLLFTKAQIEVAKDRYEKKGSPKVKSSFLGNIFR